MGSKIKVQIYFLKSSPIIPQGSHNLSVKRFCLHRYKYLINYKNVCDIILLLLSSILMSIDEYLLQNSKILLSVLIQVCIPCKGNVWYITVIQKCQILNVAIYDNIVFINLGNYFKFPYSFLSPQYREEPLSLRNLPV